MKIKRLVAPSALILLLAALSASNVQAQACGRAFAAISVSNIEGESLEEATVELMAEAPNEEYRKLLNEALARGEPEYNPALSSPTHLAAVKITELVAEEIIRLNTPMDRTEDFCENPLKPRTGTATAKVYPYGGGPKRLGFCTNEVYTEHAFLLKISAPGYVPEYYVGPYLGGCRRTYKVVLLRL